MIECIHHWYMGASCNGVVHARCLKCGAEKDYASIYITKFGKVSKVERPLRVQSPRAGKLPNYQTTSVCTPSLDKA